MAFRRPSTRMGLFTLLLSVMGLSLFGSLLAADRALVASERQLVQRDARNAALVAGRELRLRTYALAEFLEPLVDGRAVDPAGRPEGFEEIWLLGRSGEIRHGRPVTRAADSLALRAIASSALLPSSPLLRMSDAQDPRLLVGLVVSTRGEHPAIAVGRVTMPTVLAWAGSDTTDGSWFAVRAGARTLASVGTLGRDHGHLAAARIPLSGDPVDLMVARSGRGQNLRRMLWGVGVVTLIVLLAGLVRERRTAVNLAARTAELERLYQEVARSNRMKSEFLANVSHELRTPLNAIVGFVEMLREGVYGEMTPRQALPVDRIAASATHLRQLVDRLLDIAKIAAGRLEVHLEAITLRPFVLNVASEMESLVSERGLGLAIDVPQQLPRITTDQTHLRQILINLIGNAVKYTASGTIQVRATHFGNNGKPVADDAAPAAAAPPDPSRPWVALMVTDTGVGIAPADQDRIFDEFEQVNAGARTDSARRGTGLGLAISRRLARHLGGEITVLSAPGEGSTFTVWLPLEVELLSDASPEPRGRTSA